MSEVGQSETPNHVRDEGSFPSKRSPGDGCAANHFQPRSLLVAQRNCPGAYLISLDVRGGGVSQAANDSAGESA